MSVQHELRQCEQEGREAEQVSLYSEQSLDCGMPEAKFRSE